MARSSAIAAERGVDDVAHAVLLALLQDLIMADGCGYAFETTVRRIGVEVQGQDA